MMNDNDYLQLSVEEAKKGLEEGGIPIGAVIVKENKILGRGHNRLIQERKPTIHAEMDCINHAFKDCNYLDTTIYSTLRPCPMCLGAIKLFKIKRIVIGESKNYKSDPKFLQALKDDGVIIDEINDSKCASLMSRYIKENPDKWDKDIGNKSCYPF